MLSSNFRIGHRHLTLLRQLNLWTLCCELSVATGVHDCFEESMKHRLMQRLQGSEVVADGGDEAVSCYGNTGPPSCVNSKGAHSMSAWAQGVVNGAWVAFAQ